MDHQIIHGNSKQGLCVLCAHTHTNIYTDTHTHMQAAAAVNTSKLQRQTAACICLNNVMQFVLSPKQVIIRYTATD